MVWGRSRLGREEAHQRGWCWWKDRPTHSTCPLSRPFSFVLKGHLMGTISLLFVGWPVDARGEMETESPGAGLNTGVARGFVGSAGAMLTGWAGSSP